MTPDRIELMKRIFWNRSMTEAPLSVLCRNCDQSQPQTVTDPDGSVTGVPGSEFCVYPMHAWAFTPDGETVVLSADDLEECGRVLNRNFILLPCPFEDNCRECPAFINNKN